MQKLTYEKNTCKSTNLSATTQNKIESDLDPCILHIAGSAPCSLNRSSHCIKIKGHRSKQWTPYFQT